MRDAVFCQADPGNPNKKAWTSLDCFGRIVTFQWVRTNKNKKMFRPDPDPRWRARDDSLSKRRYDSTISACIQVNSELFDWEVYVSEKHRRADATSAGQHCP
jgi:hypothetical protein